MKLFNLPFPLFEENSDEPTGEGTTGTKEEPGSEENQEESEEGSEEGEEGEESEELSEKELGDAKALFRMLKDPSLAPAVIRGMAEKAGLLSETTTRTEVKENKKDLKELIKTKLGKDYQFLAEELGNVLEAVLEEERQFHQTQLSVVEARDTEREVQGVLDKLASETKGESRKFENRMIELMDKFVIGKDVSINDYIRGLYTQATASSKSATIKGKMADKINRNANDVASRLQTRSGTGTTSVSKPGGKMNLNQSVAFALEQIEKEGQQAGGAKKK